MIKGERSMPLETEGEDFIERRRKMAELESAKFATIAGLRSHGREAERILGLRLRDAYSGWKKFVEKTKNSKSDVAKQLEGRFHDEWRQEVSRIQASLAKEYKKNPQRVVNFFSDAISSLPSLEQFIRDNNLDALVEMPETTSTRRWIDKHRNPKRKRGVDTARREALSQELAQTLSIAVCEGGGNWQDTLSVEALRDLVFQHEHNFARVEQRMQELVKEKSTQAKQTILAAVERGELPIKPAVVEERLQNVTIKVFDAIAAHFKEKGGDFVPESEVVRVSSDLKPDELYHVIMHEFLHLLSGAYEVEQSGEVTTRKGITDVIRTGLHFQKKNWRIDEKLTVDYVGQLAWLDEAITEKTAVALSRLKNNWAYLEEQEILQLLIDAGLSNDLFTGAYFENYIARESSGIRPLERTRALFNETDRLFGHGFLNKLNAYMKQKGGWGVVHGDERTQRMKESTKELHGHRENLGLFIDGWYQENTKSRSDTHADPDEQEE